MWNTRAKSAPGIFHRIARRRDRCALPGFSLMELMVVVVIVGVLAAMAIPTFGGSIARQRVVAAGNRISADLQFAATVARQEATPRGVNFNSGTRSYSMLGIADPDRPAQAYSVDLSIEPYGVTSMSVNFGGSSNVLFDGFGTPGSAGAIVVASGPFQVTVTLAADGSPPTITGP